MIYTYVLYMAIIADKLCQAIMLCMHYLYDASSEHCATTFASTIKMNYVLDSLYDIVPIRCTRLTDCSIRIY